MNVAQLRVAGCRLGASAMAQILNVSQRPVCWNPQTCTVGR